MIRMCYESCLEKPGSEVAHRILHTKYQSKRRIDSKTLPILTPGKDERLCVSVCIGTGCFVRGSEKLLKSLIKYVQSRDLVHLVKVEATFCFEKCAEGPNVRVGDRVFGQCTLEKAREAIDAALACQPS